jgi:hypothetical protein
LTTVAILVDKMQDLNKLIALLSTATACSAASCEAPPIDLIAMCGMILLLYY